MITISDLSVRFGEEGPLFFDGLSLGLEGYKVHALNGRNGSGKSTLFRALRGELAPTVQVEGTLAIQKLQYNLAHSRRQTLQGAIGMVCQDFDSMIADEFTFNENLRFAGLSTYPSLFKRLTHTPFMPAFIERFGIDPEVPAHLLSGGQRQILALLMVLQKRPSVLLLDEPTATLDSVNSRMVFEFLQELTAMEMLTVLVICHDEDLVQQFVTGQIIQLVDQPNGTRAIMKKGMQPWALFNFPGRISIRREAPDAAADDEGIALAISEKADAADGRLAADQKLREKSNKALMLDKHIERLLGAHCLSEKEAEDAMERALNEPSPYQVAALLTVMKYRGETAAELAGMARAIQRHANILSLPYPVLDIVGTGGDRAKTVNISTGSAILAATCGIPMAKHGGRSVSSMSGAADVLEAFGIDLEMPAEQVEECVNEAGIAFLFAPHFYPCLKEISPIRRGLRFPTAVNLFMCLLNPARAESIMVGVASELALNLMSEAIVRLGITKRALVFHGTGLDELTPLGPIQVREICNGRINQLVIDPQELGFAKCSLKQLQGGNAQENAEILKDVFAGQPGAIADSLVLTTGCALSFLGRAKSLQEGVNIARVTLKRGDALRTLDKWIQFSTKTKSMRQI